MSEQWREVNGDDTWRIFRLMAEFVDAFESLSGIGQAVSIFGSARTPPDHPDYLAAQETARLIAKKGYPVITGGGPGIMEAGNKGAIEAGGESIGLNITLPQEQEANRYQTISVDFRYFYARKVCFTKYAAAFICFPGGFGTLDECFENLTLIQTLKIKPFPVVLYGSAYWGGLVQWMKQQLIPRFIDGEDVDIFRVVDTPADAVKQALTGMNKPWWKPLDAAAAITDAAPTAAARKTLKRKTGEGTRQGKKATVAQGPVAKPSRRPQQ